MKPFESLDQPEPTFTLLELPGYVDSFQDLYDQLDGELTIDVGDDEDLDA